MSVVSLANPTWRAKARLFLALSRTPHGLLDLALPALAALTWLGELPPAWRLLLGLITVFAGYTAVYALNDLVDYRRDQEKLAREEGKAKAAYLDAAIVRHPLAQGLLTVREASLWVAGWALAALAGAYILNPVCAAIFLLGCLLEAAYCLLLTVTWMRAFISGVVKTLGGVAAVFAVDPHPAFWFLALLCLWVFCWEIGGQNTPADWHDVAEDAALGARTIPVHLGLERASRLVLITLAASTALGPLVLAVAPLRLPWSWAGLALAAGGGLLLWPAYGLYCTRARDQASRLFNRASYYPLALLVIVLLNLRG